MKRFPKSSKQRTCGRTQAHSTLGTPSACRLMYVYRLHRRLLAVKRILPVLQSHFQRRDRYRQHADITLRMHVGRKSSVGCESLCSPGQGAQEVRVRRPEGLWTGEQHRDPVLRAHLQTGKRLGLEPAGTHGVHGAETVMQWCTYMWVCRHAADAVGCNYASSSADSQPGHAADRVTTV
jgi:hypothetical protein